MGSISLPMPNKTFLCEQVHTRISTLDFLIKKKNFRLDFWIFSSISKQFFRLVSLGLCLTLDSFFSVSCVASPRTICLKKDSKRSVLLEFGKLPNTYTDDLEFKRICLIFRSHTGLSTLVSAPQTKVPHRIEGWAIIGWLMAPTDFYKLRVKQENNFPPVFVYAPTQQLNDILSRN